MSIATNANSVFRDFVTDGVPASGQHQPVKGEIRTLFGNIAARVDQFPSGTILGRVSAGTGASEYLTGAQVKTAIGVDWFNLDDYIGFTAGTGDPATAPNVTTEFQAAVTAAIAGNRILRIRGWSIGVRWIRIDPMTIPSEIRIEVSGRFGIRSTSSTARFLLFRRRPVIRGELIIDGGRTFDNVLSGYFANHTGTVLEHETADTQIDNPIFEGVSWQNFGDMGLETYYCNDLFVDDCNGTRIGVAGAIHWSVVGGRMKGGKWNNFFPGIPIGANWANGTVYTASPASYAFDPTDGRSYVCLVNHTSPGSGTFAAYRSANPTHWREFSERNAYGASASMYIGKRQSTDFDFREMNVSNVPTWTGLDTHTSRRIRFIDNIISGCSQGIAAENHIAGQQMQYTQMVGNTITGFGDSVTKDNMVCYSVLGIGSNSSDAFQGLGLVIKNNTIAFCGEKRPGITSGGGAIVTRFIRSASIEGNIIRDARQVGIYLNGATLGTDDSYLMSIKGNVIDSVIAHTGINYGIARSQAVGGMAMGNIVSGLSAGNAYTTLGSSVNPFTFGTVSALGIAGDNFTG